MGIRLDSLEKFDALPRTKRLKNGLTLVHIPKRDDPRFYLGVTIAAGARYEDEKANGAAHFLEHMMFRGSRKYPTFRKLSRAFEWLGGEWNAATGYEHTEYWFSGNLSSWPKVIELFADFVCHPKLNDLHIERDVIRRELQKETNEYGLNTDLDFQSFSQIWPKSGLARPILGDLEHINKISLSAIRKYRRDHYIPSRMVICAVGGNEDEPILEQLEEHFSSYQPRALRSRKKLKKLPSYQGPKVRWLEHSDNEYHLQLSFVCGPEWGPEAHAVSLISRILADGYFSRLGARLRETLGLVYYVEAQPNLFSDNGTLDITASVGPQELEAFLFELLKILKKLQQMGPSLQEVKLAKARALMDMELMPTDPEVLGFRWSWSILSGKNPSLKNTAEEIATLDQDALTQAAKKIFCPENSSLVILGPHDEALQKKINDIFLQFEF
ncbi:MAG: M16 family metallopeptidase [Oligoflexus sp.]